MNWQVLQNDNHGTYREIRVATASGSTFPRYEIIWDGGVQDGWRAWYRRSARPHDEVLLDHLNNVGILFPLDGLHAAIAHCEYHAQYGNWPNRLPSTGDISPHYQRAEEVVKGLEI